MKISETDDYKIVLLSFLIITLLVSSLFFLDLFTKESVSKISGLTITRVTVMKLNDSICNFHLEQNWNLVSFFCFYGYHLNVTYALSNISGKYQSIFAYTWDLNDRWKSYNPSLPSWVVQDLNYVDRFSGYWIRMNEPSDYYYNGSRARNNQIPIYAGWNLIGYPSFTSEDANYSFSSIYGNYTIVWIYDANQKVWKYFIEGANETSTTFNVTSPYFGYWINASANVMWVVDW